jgi:TP901 family phage tail tape measure protein
VSDRVVKVRLLAQVSEYEAGMLKAAQATRRTGSELEKLEQKKQAFEAVGRGLMVTGAALAGVTALSVKAAMGWESAWAGVTKTVEGTPEQLSKVEAGLRGLTSVLPASHDEIAAVAEAAGQLGIQTGNVVAFTRTMIDLGETTNLSANDAATSLARFVNIMGTSQDKVSNLGSALVGLGNNYATTEREIMEMAMRLAGAGKQIGLSEGQVLGLSTALSSVGIEAEAGGSAMSKVMIDIASSVESGGEKLDKFATAAGMSAQDFAKQWKTDPASALASFVKGLSNAESQGKSTLGVLADLGITEVRMRDALLRSSSAADQFAGAMAKGSSEFEKNNALTDEAAKRYETVESKLKIAGNAVRDAAIDFGQVFLPMVGAAAEGVADFAQTMGNLPDPVQGIIGILTGAGGSIALVGGLALLAVPKIAAFKVAMSVLTGTTFSFRGGLMSALRFMTGPWGVGLAAATAAVITFNAAIEAGTPKQAEVRNAIVTGTEAMEGFKKAFKYDGFAGVWFGDLKAEMADIPGLLAKVDDGMADVFQLRATDKGALDALHTYGDALNELAQTDMPRAMQTFAALSSEMGWNGETSMRVLKEMGPLYDTYLKQADAAGIAADSTEFMQMVLMGLPPALDDAEGGLTDIETAAADAAQALDGTAQALDDVAGKAMSMGDAHDRALSALNAMADAAKAEGVSLDGTNDASVRLRDSIRDVEQASRDSADAIINNGGSVKDAAKEWEAGRQKVIDMRVAKGEDIETAKAWADKNLGSASEVTAALEDVYQAWLNLPENRETKYKVEAAEAESRLEALKKSIEGLPQYKSITLETITLSNNRVLSAPGQATGGPVYGPGPKGVDSELRMLAPGEHVLTADDVDAMGGQAAVMAMRSGLHSSRSAALVPARSGGGGGGGGGTQVAADAPKFDVIVQSKGGVDLLQYIDVRVEQSDTRLKAALRG